MAIAPHAWEGILLGTLIALALWWGLYEVSKPQIAATAGNYVRDHALDNVPPAVQPLVTALGADTYAALLGSAVQNAIVSTL